MPKPTPMMEQYKEIKSEAKDAILFFRLGDFYEMFGQDAHEASKILDIALTSRSKDEDAIPMCGIPFHAAENYIAKLTRAGKKVAVCEQISDPSLPGIVKRKIVKIITPGTTLSDQILNKKANNYILAIYVKKDYFGFAFADNSTGEFQAGELSGIEALKNEILRLCPAEIILDRDQYDDPVIRALAISLSDTSMSGGSISKVALFEEPYKFLLEKFRIKSLEAFGIGAWPFAIQASAILMAYLLETQKDAISHIDKITAYQKGNFMNLDESTIRNLELFTTLHGDENEGTLLKVIDFTLTAMGARLLRKCLSRPLIRKEEILSRHEAVDELIKNENLRGKLRELFSNIADIERTLARLCSGSANARDLKILGESLSYIPQIKSILQNAESDMFLSLSKDLLPLEKLSEMISKAVEEETPLRVTEGGIIKDNWNTELDELRALMKGGKSALKRIEAQEIETTKINSLKVSYNRVFGYYIEISRVNLARVPAHYIRKQTLANAERFITPELKEYEEKVLSAEEKSFTLEYQIFRDLLDSTLTYIKDIKQNAAIIAEIDVLFSFAAGAIKRNYVRPILSDSRELSIKEGRHPVVECMTFENAFVPNDSEFNSELEIILLTGPNMSGKSTYLRQVALIALLNQIGSFVPAKQATLPIFDRIFTRVGASDNLVRGQSTFMVEMQESAYILNHATERSLIILDEIGRGTSTYDGLSIAWAIFEFLHDKIRAFTLFATHYHELIEVAQKFERASNFSVDVKENSNGVLFLHKIVQGGIDKSYGIEVAKLAGIPREITNRSTEILKDLESEKIQGPPRKISENQMGLFTGNFAAAEKYMQDRHPALEKLKGIDINSLTPLDALIALGELKKL